MPDEQLKRKSSNFGIKQQKKIMEKWLEIKLYYDAIRMEIDISSSVDNLRSIEELS